MSAKTNKARNQLWAEEQIARAKYFTAVMFLGFPVGYDRREAFSLEEARALRQKMLEEHKEVRFGSTAVIYAVCPGGVTVIVE